MSHKSNLSAFTWFLERNQRQIRPDHAHPDGRVLNPRTKRRTIKISYSIKTLNVGVFEDRPSAAATSEWQQKRAEWEIKRLASCVFH